ncbi:MAG: SMI1/KNR4 family protein [Ottowia sp.]|uniref:SMI1/KNR4 family protein n=1 Tax=Ottowia sp. TaxID=1898956 RepID=UPI0039E22CDD
MAGKSHCRLTILQASAASRRGLIQALGAQMTLLEIVDKFLDRSVSEGINCLPMPIPADMATGQVQDDWNYWIPIDSKVTDSKLKQLETEIGLILSPQYKSILQHRHFMSLQIQNVGFFKHPSVGWQESLKKEIFHGGPYELLLGKGFLPFADYSDWGLWCFSIKEQDSQGEYSVYLWDHDQPDKLEFVSGSLHSALIAELSSGRT